ncbi:ATP-binding protein [Candidatus Pacearchaeota archaeon]|nr:ATP-binding protein [Candidatus Pacearchaeota archaeon]
MRYIITGGPGFGKTSIIKNLNKKGFPFVGESSRNLINELIEKEGKDPREDRNRFQILIVKKRIQDFFDNNQDIVFFDRGVFDEIAYSLFYQREPTDECKKFCKEHKYDKVFIVPPWKEIYKKDELRNESYEKAVALHNEIVKAYKETGHEILEIPKLTVEERVNYVLDKIKN